MNYYHHCVISSQERTRIENIGEPFDEFEEWHLKCSHYTLLTAFQGQTVASLPCCIWPQLCRECPVPTVGRCLTSQGTIGSEARGQSSRVTRSTEVKLLRSSRGIGSCRRRYGHTATVLSSRQQTASQCSLTTVVAIVGGFGEKSADCCHGRISDIEILELEDKNTSLYEESLCVSLYVFNFFLKFSYYI